MTPVIAKKKTQKETAAKKKAAEESSSARRRTNGKSKLYASLVVQLLSLLKGEHDFIANAANFSALLFNSLPNVNWAGFYFLQGEELVLGPFQGNPACVRIPMGTGRLRRGGAAVGDDHRAERARVSGSHRVRRGFEFGDRGAVV
jgi:putative methionine-R-sulfoxide reductase with GAF domain